MENKTEVKIFDSPAKVTKAVAKEINRKVKHHGKTAFHLALSGGSTPIPLFEILADKYRDKISWSRIHFWWSDERCVEPASPDSNYGKAWDTLLSKVPVPEENIHRIRGEEEPDMEAERYSRAIAGEVSLHGRWPVFDLVLLGMGDDGHVASIFPNQLHLLESDRFCEVATHPALGQKRITLTGKVINHARHLIMLVTGEKKSQCIAAIMNKRKNGLKLPAYHIEPVEGTLDWYLDVDAASRI